MSARIRVGILALVAAKSPASLAVNNGREVRVIADAGECSDCGGHLWGCEATKGTLSIALYTSIGEITLPLPYAAFHTNELIPLDGNLDGTDEGADADKPVDREVTA